MKRIKDTIIIAVDHGYGNIKTANTVTPASVAVCAGEPIFSGSILTYDGISYRIGEGHKEFSADKTSDIDYYILTLMAIAKELSYQGIQSAKVHLAAGLPLTWIRRQKESFRDYLMQNDKVNFSYNKRDYQIEFTGCSLYPQSYPAVIGKVKEFGTSTMLADIGNGTMNILCFHGSKPLENKCWTEKLGVHQCMIASQNAILDTFGSKVDSSIIEQIIRHGNAKIPAAYGDVIRTVCKSYCRDITDALKRYEYNPDLMDLVVAGGGVSLFNNFAEYDAEKVFFIDDLCATAKGYELLAYESLCRKEAR